MTASHLSNALCRPDRSASAPSAITGRLVGYARFSTDAQNLRPQRDALNALGCVLIFEDVGISGAKLRRTGLDSALAALIPGDTLVVWRLDRLGRSLGGLIDLLGDLTGCGVGFRSLCEAIDVTSASGRLVLHVMAAMAAFKRALISERTVAGMAAAKRRGLSLGRPRKLSAL